MRPGIGPQARRLRRRSEARLSSLDSVKEALEKGLAQAGLSPMVGGTPAEDLKRELREALAAGLAALSGCLLYTSPSPRD